MKGVPESGADLEIHEAILLANSMDAKSMLWFRLGSLAASLVIMGLVVYFMIIRREVSPLTEMVAPATTFLEKGVHDNKDLPTLSTQMHFAVIWPDLRQLGVKLSRSTASRFGGVPAAVMECQYGKSVLLLYRFNKPSNLYNDMQKSRGKSNLFFYVSDQAVSVVVWKDKKVGYYGLAAKATEKDLLTLADKMVPQL